MYICGLVGDNYIIPLIPNNFKHDMENLLLCFKLNLLKANPWKFQFVILLKLVTNITQLANLNACTQAAIRLFLRNFAIAPKRSFIFPSEIRNFENCTQIAIHFSQPNKKFRIVPKLPFILWLQNTKFLKLFRNSHLLFDNKLKKLKIHPNCHLSFDYEMQNLKSPKRPFVFYQKQQI